MRVIPGDLVSALSMRPTRSSLPIDHPATAGANTLEQRTVPNFELLLAFGGNVSPQHPRRDDRHGQQYDESARLGHQPAND